MARKEPTKVSGNYASGIAVPFKADGDGGIALQEGDPYIRGQVLATVSPNESDNPFQDLGGDDSPIFQNADDIEWKQAMELRIVRQFDELEQNNLARLMSLEFGDGDEEGNFEVLIEYINLESTESRDITINLQTGAALPGFV